MENQKKLILYIAQSLDGFIAGPGDDLQWLSMVETPGEDYGYHKFTDSVDTVIMGRRTYEKVLSFGIEFPHKSRKCYVVSSTKTGRDENVEFVKGDLETFVNSLKSTNEKNPKNIYLDGGGQLTQEMLRLGLVDEMTISIIPVLLGGGLPLFGDLKTPLRLQLRDCQSFASGLVQLRYSL